MKTKFLLLICCVIVTNLQAQISTINVAEKQERKSFAINQNVYDERWNYPFNNKYELLIGEELYVLPLPTKSTIYNQSSEKGYKGFKTVKFNVTKDKESSKRYGNPAPEDKTNTKVEDLQNKIFIVKGFESSDYKYQLYRYCLLLEEKGNPQNVCKYAFNHQHDFNTTFVTMKHYGYLKERCIGKQFYFDESCLPKNDSKTGADLRNRSQHSWECKDIIISPESGKLTMLLSHENEETFLYEYAGSMEHSTSSSVLESVAGARGTATQDLDQFIVTAYSSDAWTKNVNKYGEDMMWQALNHKVVIGMPSDLVVLALGRANNGNAASYGTQLVYKIDYKKIISTHCIPYVKFQNGRDEMYVYLDKNGLVTGWN